MDDDPANDWKRAAKTAVDPSLAETAPHGSLDYLAGREAGFSDGIDRAIAAIEWELVLTEFDEAARSPILSRIRESALRRG